MPAIDTRLPGLLRGGEPLVGTFVGIPSPALVEMCGYAGFDFVIIDNEHGPQSLETTEHMIRAARCAGTIPVVRAQEAELLRVLDAGASGVQVPSVDSPEQARRVVAACKYPPLGRRSAAFTARAGGYTFHAGPEAIHAANEGVAIILTIESVEAVANLDAILEVRGVDAVFVGLTDLALSMGHPGDNSHPRVQEALAGVFDKAAKAGVASGVLAGNPVDFGRYASMGARYLPMTLTSMIAGALREAVAMRKGARAGAPRPG
jgi:4-hydroxy-2-oxoheptanedioate aldolase